MTDLDLDAIRERLDAATPEPWVYSDVISNEHNVTRNGWDVASCRGGDVHPDIRQHHAAADARFIANAPADIRALLAEVKRMSDRADARIIRTPEDLAALPPLTVIREVFRPSPSGKNYGGVWERQFQGQEWVCIAGGWIDRTDPPTIPATVLWHPEDGAQ